MTFDSIELYVEDIECSRAFYSTLFNCDALVLSPTFMSFNLTSCFTLQLKQREQVIPVANTLGGGTELSLAVESRTELNKVYKEWQAKGVEFLQEPTELVFGMTFVGLDPDNHRIRVFCQ
ncbi:VOC family protein [Vibrio profundi]|uniref:VOC family protein n=1 Tax=Vibrio profundi TaxID=1774960 RepID=UPI003736257C